MPDLLLKNIGKSIPVVQFTITENSNEIGIADVTIPTIHLRADDGSGLLDVYQEPIEIWDNGTMYFNGVCKTYIPYPELNDSVNSASVIKLKCDDPFGFLACEPPLEIHFQDTDISVILTTLLSQIAAPTFTIVNFINLTDEPITVDLRGKDNLWSQITEAMSKAQAATYMRYVSGDPDNGYGVEIGYFRNQVDSNFAILGKNVVAKPEFQESDTEPLKSITPVSGDSLTSPVNLQDALNIDPTLNDASQDFQIVGNKVVNNTITKGCNARKEYSVVKTEGDEEPTQDELNQAAITLYYNAAKELQDSVNRISINANVVLGTRPKLYDAMWFDSNVFEPDFNPIIQSFDLVETFRLRRWLRILSITIDYRDRQKMFDETLNDFLPYLVYKVEITNADRRNRYDVWLQLNEKIDSQEDLNDPLAELAVNLGYKSIKTLTRTRSGGSPNCGGATGREFDFDFSSLIPASASGVTIDVSSITQGYEVQGVVQTGSVSPYADHVLCIKPTGSIWSLADSASVQITLYFI